MVKSWKSFVAGALTMLALGLAGYMFFAGTDKNVIPENKPADTVVPSNMVTITTLPPLLILSGTEVPFEGKVELRQTIAGRAAQNISIVNFQASGEHSEKSSIKIVWENGEIEKISPGTKDKKFPPDRRAAEISVIGYSMYERRIFQDLRRKGTLTWEIRYEPFK